MGYTTEFDGFITVEPPLNNDEIAYLKKFAGTRRMKRTRGPYFIDGSGEFGGGQDEDILEYNSPDPSQPGLWCQWIPSDDGTVIEWDGQEKFYHATEWMQYIIQNFLEPVALAFRSSDPQFNNFTFDHYLNGEIYAQGEDPDDQWTLTVANNGVVGE